MQPLPADTLPPGIRARFIDGVNGLSMHVLEAGEPGRPCLLLLHGFPELAYSWRRVMRPLADAGFHVVAPDQRGYGRTTGEDRAVLAQVRFLNLVRDAMGLLSALGIAEVACVVGHDFGSPVAGFAALARPDIFRACVLMSAPFPGAPPFPLPPARRWDDFHTGLKELGRKHYQWHYSSDAAAAEMDAPAQGLHAFLRAYYHGKSGDWAANRPFALKGWTADELAKLPDYYVMPLDLGMAETVLPYMPGPAEVAACTWLTDAELAVYAAEYARTGFGGGLLWYRAVTSGLFAADLELFAGRRIEVPTQFIAGDRDWGIHQSPGLLDAMPRAMADWRGSHLIEGAGHWVQQERPEAVTALLLGFLADLQGLR